MFSSNFFDATYTKYTAHLEKMTATAAFRLHLLNSGCSIQSYFLDQCSDLYIAIALSPRKINSQDYYR